MKTSTRGILCLSTLLVSFALSPLVMSQGLYEPLTLQGMEQSVVPGARTRALGNASVALGNESSVLFTNPAALMQLEAGEVRLGAAFYGYKSTQDQAWNPNRFYPNLSLLMENSTGGIKDPVVTNPADKLQRPYDNLLPNWEKTRSSFRPAMASAALPLAIGDVKVVAGLGFAEMVNLDYYYQNNNNMVPNIGQYRPSPMPVLRGSDTLVARWFSSFVERKGSISRITPALSVTLFEQVSLGAAVTILTGSSDDTELQVGRGRLVFDAVYRVRNDSVYSRISSAGTSNYSGILATLGAFYRGERVSVGVTIQPPMTITRDWSQAIRNDTTGRSTVINLSGSDKLSIPLQVAVGFALHPTERWNIGADYTLRQYDDASYSLAGGGALNPWLSSKSVRAGVEFKAADGIQVRGGYREDVQVFAPEGAGLIGEPVRGSAYTGGVGLRFGAFGVDVAYEYKRVFYQDLWETNTNTNTAMQHTFLVETSMQF